MKGNTNVISNTRTNVLETPSVSFSKLEGHVVGDKELSLDLEVKIYLHSTINSAVLTVLSCFSLMTACLFIPQIISLKHFQLPKGIDPLLTWIHGRTWLDNIFLRCPLITSMVHLNKDQLKELKETVTNASKAATKQQEQNICKDLAIIPNKKLMLDIDHKENSLNVEPVKNLCEDSMSMNSDEFDNEIPSVHTVVEDRVPHHTQQPSEETTEEEEEGLDMSLLIV